jgi:hypothetical protein
MDVDALKEDIEGFARHILLNSIRSQNSEMCICEMFCSMTNLTLQGDFDFT